MKSLSNKKYLLNNRFKGRQSIQLFLPETDNKHEVDGTDIIQLLQVVQNELKETSMKDEQKIIQNLITNIKLKSSILI